MTPTNLLHRLSAEQRILLLLTGQIFFFALALSLLEIAGSALFLVDFGAQALPYVYMAIAICVSLLSYGYANQLERRPMIQVATTAVVLFGALLLAAWFGLIGLNLQAISFGLMVMLTLGYQMNFVVIGGQAGRLFDVRQMKRLFPIVLTGLTVGFMAGGILLPLLQRLLGATENLLIVAAISMLLSLGLLRITLAQFRTALADPPRPASASPRRPNRSLRQLLRKPYILHIFLYQMLSAVGTQLVLFLFLAQAALTFPNVAELAQFFGYFTIVLNLLTILFLAAPAGYLLNRYGLRLGIAANPLLVALILVAMLVTGSGAGLAALLFFWLAVSGRLFDIMLSVGTTNPSIKAAYQLLSSRDRPIVEAAVEGIGVPVAFGLAGVILLIFNAFPTLTALHLTWFTLLVTLLWTAAGALLYRSYRHALTQVLSRRAVYPVEVSLDDGLSVAAVEQLLHSHDLGRVRLALELLTTAEHPRLDQHLLALIDHPTAAVRCEAWARLEVRLPDGALQVVESALQSENDAAVQGAALQTLCALAAHGAVDNSLIVAQMQPYLAHCDAEIRLGALAGLLRHGGIMGIGTAWEVVRQLQESAVISDRALLATLIGRVGNRTLYHPLLRLLDDEELVVRRAALVAAGAVPHPQLVSLLIQNLTPRSLRSLAAQALVASGVAMLPVAAQRLARSAASTQEEEQDTLIRLLRICGQIKEPQVVEILKPYINHRDDLVRRQLLATLALSGYRAQGAADVAAIEQALCAETKHGLSILFVQQHLAQDAAPMLHRSLQDALAQVCQRLFLLISFLHEPRAILQAEERLASAAGNESALALEFLDVTLSRSQKALLFPFIDPKLTFMQRIQLLNEQLPLAVAAHQDPLAALIGNVDGQWNNSWLRACAIYTAGTQNFISLMPSIEEAAASRNRLICETADWALASLSRANSPSRKPAGVPTLYQREETMLLTIEKVAILKGVDIFANAPDYVLAAVAAIAEEVDTAPGETLIQEGDLGDCMYIVVDGEVRVHSGNHTFFTLGAGKSVGELAVLDPEPRAASVTSVGDAQFFRIDKDAFAEVMADRPEIAQGVIRALCQRVRLTTKAHKD